MIGKAPCVAVEPSPARRAVNGHCPAWTAVGVVAAANTPSWMAYWTDWPALISAGLCLVLGILLAILFQSDRFRQLAGRTGLDARFISFATSLMAMAVLIVAIFLALHQIGHGIVWDKPIPGLGELTPLVVIRLLVLIIVTFYLASLIKRYLMNHFLARSGLEPALQYAIGQLAGYALLVIGLLLVMQNTGVDFTPLTFFAGALGIGLGFGLQNLASNFISGLVILTERPIKVGDRIQIEALEGTVIEIRPRSTTVRSNDNIDIIVPNSDFITKRIINLSHNDNRVRFKIPIGVHYNSDVQLVEKALLEAAEEAPHVLAHPNPGVRFLEFGDSALNFELRVWSDSLLDRPNALRSELNFLIWKKFKQYEIEIPYPQRDVHLHQAPD